MLLLLVPLKKDMTFHILYLLVCSFPLIVVPKGLSKQFVSLVEITRLVEIVSPFDIVLVDVTYELGHLTMLGELEIFHRVIVVGKITFFKGVIFWIDNGIERFNYICVYVIVQI